VLAPHVCGKAQLPQLEAVRGLPQLSTPEKVPQVRPKRWQNCQSASGRQAGEPHTPGTPEPPQLVGALQVPQLAIERGLPQRSVTASAPQVLPSRVQSCASDSGVHPQAFA
jgi:hypothetical protein